MPLAGWLEGGLIASPEKFLMDCEILQQIQRYMDPDLVATDAREIALDCIESLGNDGHFRNRSYARALQRRLLPAFLI